MAFFAVAFFAVAFFAVAFFAVAFFAVAFFAVAFLAVAFFAVAFFAGALAADGVGVTARPDTGSVELRRVQRLLVSLGQLGINSEASQDRLDPRRVRGLDGNLGLAHLLDAYGSHGETPSWS